MVNVEQGPEIEVPFCPPVPEHSRFQESIHATKRMIGRFGVILALAIPATAAVYSTEAALHPETAAAETGGYPDADAADCSAVHGIYSWCKGSPSSLFSQRGFVYRNCTDWAAYRTEKLTGVAVPKGTGMGNGADWDENGRKAGYTVDQTPEPGDIAQNNTLGGGVYGHVGVVEQVNKDAQGKIISITISQYNQYEDGTFSNPTYTADANGNFWFNKDAGHKWENFIDLNGTGVGANGETFTPGNTSTGAAAERSVVKTSDNNYYLKHGGVFWHLGSGLSADAISQWGTYAGSVDTGQLHDREVNYTRDGYTPGAHPPIDGTVVQQPNSTQLYTFIGGEAFPLGSMAEVDALGLRNRIGTIPGGKLVPEFFEVPNLPDGFLFKKFGGAAVRMATGNISQWVSSESALACVELRVGGTNLVPASFEDRLAANGRISPETVGCEFPANWTLNVPGSSQRWRITGDGKGRPYVRYDYPNMLAIACGTNGQPAYQQLRSTAALTSITSGGTLHCPENTFLRDSDYGHIYQYKGGALHKVPSMNTLSCLNNPNLISTKQEYLGGIAVGSDVACSLEGRVIKEPTGQIWYIKDGQRHYAQNMAIVNGLLGRVFSTGGQLTSTSAQEANSYVIGANAYVPYGPPIFAKYAGDARVWLVLRDGTKRHALSLCNGASPMTLPDGEFDGHKITTAWSANQTDCVKIANKQDI